MPSGFNIGARVFPAGSVKSPFRRKNGENARFPALIKAIGFAYDFYDLSHPQGGFQVFRCQYAQNRQDLSLLFGYSRCATFLFYRKEKQISGVPQYPGDAASRFHKEVGNPRPS